MILCNVIFILHLFLVLFIVIVPFTKADVLLMLLHAIIVPCILIHWGLNDNTCCLTLLEQALRKDCKPEQLFFHQLVGPVYNADRDSFVVVCMIVLMTKSICNVYDRYDELVTNLRLIFK